MAKVLNNLAASTRIALVLIVASCLAALVACSTGVCSNNQNSIPCAGFFSASDGAAISVRDLAIGGIGAPDDSLLYTIGTTLSTIYLPLRSDQNTTSYRFHFNYLDYIDSETGEEYQDHSADDIVTFSYSKTPFFDGEDCGAMYHFMLEGVDYTKHYIDSIAVTDPFITNVDRVRIKIFFRTREPEPEPEPDTPGTDNPDTGDEDTGDEDTGNEDTGDEDIGDEDTRANVVTILRR